MTVVVTGGSGLLGQHVIAELAEHGYDVLSLDRKPHPAGFRPSWAVDLADPGSLFEACSRASSVIHLAAHIAPNLAPDCRTFNDNVNLTYNVLKAATTMRVKRIVVASSIAAYGFLYGSDEQTPLYLPLDEDHPCRPTDPYGLSKIVGETVADSFALASGTTIVSLRLPGINYDRSYERIKRRMDDPAFRKRGFWTYIDARDAATAFRLSLEADLAGHRIFNVAAPTSNMRQPTQQLIRRFFPDLKDIRQVDGMNWSGMSSERAGRDLGFRARHLWEKYINV